MKTRIGLLLLSLSIAFAGCGNDSDVTDYSDEMSGIMESETTESISESKETDTSEQVIVESSDEESSKAEDNTDEISKPEYKFEFKWYEKNAPAVDFRGEYYVWRDEDFTWKIQNYYNAYPCIRVAEDAEGVRTIDFWKLNNNVAPYSELKTEEQVYPWHIGMCDGVLEEYRHGKVGRTIYCMKERIPFGALEFEPDRVPRKFYRVIWGHDDCDAVLYVDFPYDWTRDQVDEVLDKIHVELTVDVLGEE